MTAVPAAYGSGATEINGSMPINTDGGCLANGEPMGASGLRQVYEMCCSFEATPEPGRSLVSRERPSPMSTGPPV